MLAIAYNSLATVSTLSHPPDIIGEHMFALRASTLSRGKSAVYVDALMPIPPFEGEFLPPGALAGEIELAGADGGPVEIFSGWPTDLHEIEDRFVIRFVNTTTRQVLFQELRQMIAWITKRVPCAQFHVSGPFVTAEEDPTELHLGVVLLPSALDELDRDDFWSLNHMLDDGERIFAGGGFKITTQLAQLRPVDDDAYEDTLEELALIRYVCCVPLGDDRHAGYVQFTLCDEGGDTDREVLEFLANAVASP